MSEPLSTIEDQGQTMASECDCDRDGLVFPRKTDRISDVTGQRLLS